jgi:acetyl-CoA acetyltransferase family protein
MGRPVILSAVRTAIAHAGKGALRNSTVHDVAAAPIAEALARSGVEPTQIDDVVFGEVLAGGGVISRYATLAMGLPVRLPGMAVNRHCASGMTAVQVGAGSIAAGMADVIIAGGVEFNSPKPQTFLPDGAGDGELVRWMSPTHPERSDAPAFNMGITVGENTAEQCGITREEQDHWAYWSHVRGAAANDDGRFAEEIVPMTLVDRVTGETFVFERDEKPRRDTSIEKLAALAPYYKEGGTVTAGNSSSINDGGCAIVLADEEWAARRGLIPLAIVRSWASVGVDPAETGLAPTRAVPRALARAGVPAGDVRLVELNEAFASMAVACSRILGWSHDMVNVNGSGVGIGHPVGATGARMITSLVHELRRRGGGIGVATLCAGGGMGAATVLEVLPG